jgi:hypothetical protein
MAGRCRAEESVKRLRKPEDAGARELGNFREKNRCLVWGDAVGEKNLMEGAAAFGAECVLCSRSMLGCSLKESESPGEDDRVSSKASLVYQVCENPEARLWVS